MKITITTDRKPWANGMPQDEGAEIEVPAVEGAALIKAGFAKEIAPRKEKRAADA